MAKILTNDDLVEILRLRERENKSQLYIAQEFGCGKSTIGDFLRKETYKEFWEKQKEKPIANGTTESIHDKRKPLNGKKFVFTSAQNNTFVHKDFLKSLQNYCDFHKCELVVGTFHYNKNGYSKHDDQDHNCWFDPAIREYILDEDRILEGSVVWCGSLDIIPTAANPLSGFHSYTSNKWGIVPHAKVQLKSLPVGKGFSPKQMMTTGTVTQQNYIERKAGQLASFHHVFGATVVEIDESGDAFCRQLISDSNTGEFYDLDHKFTPSGVLESDSIKAVNWGDVHAAKLDEDVAKCSWGWETGESILDKLRPQYQFVHDVFDMSFRNHHNIKNPYFRYKMFIDGTESVRDEIEFTTDVLADMIRSDSEVVVVQSNHDLALKRWLTEQDYREDPVNAEFFLEMQLASYKAIKEGNQFDVFNYACKTVEPLMAEVKFLTEDESFLICGEIECGQHGHNGNNGARGSTRAFQMQGNKFNVGHSHSCDITDGVYTAGVSGSLDMGYNKGGSSWSNSHILTYLNGKRTIVTVKNGKWRA